VAFFRSAIDDPVIAEGRELIDLLGAGHDLVWLSGRPEWLRPLTQRWLAAAGLPTGPLWLRPDGDRRPAAVFKVSRLRVLARDRPVTLLVDDDPDVIAAARAAGFNAVLAVWSRRNGAPALHEAQREGRT
jgi:hypothetical protein